MILVTGKNGQVGRALETALTDKGSSFHAVDRTELDLSFPDRIPDVLDKLRPMVIINAAAYTNVDQAEQNQELAMNVNAVSVVQLARWCAKSGARLIHYSTDYVFDGRSEKPWKEIDKPNPINVYGASKLEGERLILENLPSAIILRTSWVYASFGNNFVLKIKQLAKQKEVLSIVCDQVGTPNSASFLAQKTLEILANETNMSGIYHLSCDASTTWHGFAQFFLEQFKNHGESFLVKSVMPVLSSEFPTLAKRPNFSILDNSKLKSALPTNVFPTWQECFMKEFF